jgi:hypothetical protein
MKKLKTYNQFLTEKLVVNEATKYSLDRYKKEVAKLFNNKKNIDDQQVYDDMITAFLDGVSPAEFVSTIKEGIKERERMKKLYTYKQFVNEAASSINEAASSINALKKALPGLKFKKADFEVDPEDEYKTVESFYTNVPGISGSYGEDDLHINIYDGDSFSFYHGATPVAVSLHSTSDKKHMSQVQMEVPLPLKKLNKKIFDEAVEEVKRKFGVTESRINEAKSDLGPKAKKFDSYIDTWDYFADADDNVAREEALPKEWHDALKTLGIKADAAIVLFYDAWGDRQEVLDTAKKYKLKFAEVEDTKGGSDGIIFNSKQ